MAALVSICIPAFNAQKTLAATLDSILAQDYPHLDIVVSDNNSTDQTAEIIKSYAAKGVRYCRPSWSTAEKSNPGYIGCYANCNFVLKQAKGEYCALYHADDIYEPSIVRKQVSTLINDPTVGAVFTRMRFIGLDGKAIRRNETIIPVELLGKPIEFETLFTAVLRQFNFLPAPSAMIRSSAYEQVGPFDEAAFRTSADLDMWLRISKKYKVHVLNEILLNYRISDLQFGAQYENLRTAPADFFSVIDHHLSKLDTSNLIDQHALRCLQVYRAVDAINRSRHYLIQGHRAEAHRLLTSNVTLGNLLIGLRFRLKLGPLLEGVLLRLSSHLMFPTAMARMTQQLRSMRQRRQRLSAA